MKSQFQSLDVVVHQVLVDPIPHGFSAPMSEQAYFDPPVPEPDMDAEVVSTVPDAQSAPNEVQIAEAVGDACRTHDDRVDPPQEIPLIQNHPSKCLFRIVLWSLPLSFHPLISFFPLICAYVAEDIPNSLVHVLTCHFIHCVG
jgi:hypothetical protein